jgi:hypothetical protein
LLVPLFGDVGGAGGLDALGYILMCSIACIAGIALAGAVLRSQTLVGLSFVLAVALVAPWGWSSRDFTGCLGCAMITLFAPVGAALYLANSSRPDQEGPTEAVGSETPTPPVEWEGGGPVIFQSPKFWLLALGLLLLLLVAFAVR